MRLPPGWAETIDPKGRKYFYNAATQESLWEPPPGTIMDNVPPAMPPGPPKPPGPPPMRSGPPAMPGGPPAMPGSGPPAMPGSGPPAMPSAGPPPMRAGPPPLSINPSIGSSTSTPAASPANRSGPPPLFGGGPPPPPISPANRTGPPPLGAFPPMIGNTPPASPGGPPALPGGPPPSPGGPPALPPASPANRTGPPPMFGTMPPGGLTVPPPKPAVPLVAPASPPQGQLPSHFQGSPFATAPPAPVSRQPSFNPGAPQVGTLPPGPPPARAPGMSVSGPPPMRAPGMSVSGPPPVLNVTGVQSGALPPMRAPGMSVSGPPPMRAPGMSVSGPPPMLNVTGVQSGAPPPVRAPGMSISGPPPMRPPGMSVSGPPSTLPMIPPTPTAGTTTLPPQQFSGPLPYPWKETTAANGKTYYYNPVTQATSWTHPGLMGASPQQNAQTLSGAAGGVNQLNSLPQTGEKRFVKEYSGPISLRSGVFKSWEPRYLTIKPQSLFSVWDTEQMKKERIKINATFILAVPINRGDSRNVLAIHEYVKHAPTVISDVKQAKNTYYFDCGTNQLREELLVTLHDQGAVIRRPLFESNAMINKESRFVTVYDHQIEIFKKNTDDEADIILTFGPSTFFQNTPSQFPLLYEEGKVYGSVTPATFVVGTDCNEDQTLYYVTLQLNTNQNDTTGNQDDDAQAMIKKIKEAITQKQTKVDPTSLHEGYLYKASTNLQRWSRRYFILRRDSLTYYRLRGDEKPAGECLLPNGFEIDLHPSTAQYPSPFFVAESGDEDTRQFLMCALNDPEYQSWCDAISTLQQQKQVKKEAGSLKEGYVNLCGKKLTPHRKYVVVSPHNDTVKVYNSRNDPHSAIDIPLPKGAYISEASLPGDDTIGTQRLAILGITNPQTNAEHFFGFSQARDREEWIAVLKSIAGDAVAKSHPDSYCEGYVYKSKKKGSLGSLKYCVITPHALYYTDKKEADVLSQDPQVQKRVKKFEHTGDAVIEEDLTSIPGYRGLLVPSTGDESGGEVVLLYYSDDAAFLKAKNALKQALASVDWRRNPASTFEGYVWKSNTSGKSWAYRYAIVTQEAVSFYKRKFDKDLAGQMPLAGCSFSKHLFADVNSPTVAKEDRTALEYFASQYKSASGSTLGVTAQSAGVTPDQLTIVSIRPNSSDPKAKPIWLGSFLPSDTMQWFQVFNELSSAGKPMHPGSIKEGYLCYGGTTAAHRRYASLYPDRIDLYPSRLDTTLESTFPLAVGFDVLYKDNSLYISKSNHAVDDVLDSSVYAQFSNAVGGEVLSSWLEAFQKAYTSRVGSSSDNVRASLYANISFNKGKQEFKYVILLQDKLCIFSSRSSAFPTPLSSEPVLANAERTLPYIQAGLDVQELGPQRLQVKIYQDTLVFDFRADYEHQSFTEELKAPPGLDHVSSFVHRGTMAMPTPRKMGSPSVSGRVQAFAMSLPPPPQLDDDAPPPPMFLEEEEDAPPPPPPDFDFEEAPPPPAPDSFSSQGSFIPTTNFEFSSPISSVPEASTLPANPSGPREMPLFDDSDDDDIPEFIKEKRRQQAAAAAAAAAAPEPAQTTFISPAAVSSSGFKAPAKAGAGLGLDFEFSFDLPPAPAFDLPPPAADELPPPSAAAVSNYGVTSPTESTVRRPLFGANRAVAPTPAPVVDAKYIPVDFDDDDDDLPPPGA